MQILRFKDRFTLNQNHNQINFFWRAIFLILLAFFQFSVNANQTINLAIIDTGFCHQKLDKNNILLMPTFDATSSISSLTCDNSNKDTPRFHGQKVLETFLEQYHSKIKIRITPIIVYDNRAETKEVYWNKAMDHIKVQSFDYVISAVGIKSLNLKISKDFSPVWFLAAARISPYIKQEDSIFPQNQFSNKKVFLIGNYNSPKFIDNGLLYKDKINYFINDSKLKFNGSSFAVAYFAAEYFNICHKSLNSNQCLKFLNQSQL